MKFSVSTKAFAIIFCLSAGTAFSQSNLTVRDIMKDPKSWVGTSPSAIRWSENSENVYFEWNPDINPNDSLYKVGKNGGDVTKVTPSEKKQLPGRGVYSNDQKFKAFVKDQNIFLLNIESGETRQLTASLDRKSGLSFSKDGQTIYFLKSQNLYGIDLSSGLISQHTDFKKGKEKKERKLSGQNQWLKDDQMGLFEVVRMEAEEDSLEKVVEEAYEAKKPKTIYTGKASVREASVSPDGNFIVYSMVEFTDNDGTIVPDFVTESGYTTDLDARPKVGAKPSTRSLWVYDIKGDKTYEANVEDLPGIKDLPAYYQEYESLKDTEAKERAVFGFWVDWSDNGDALVVYRSADNKDRWICLLDAASGNLTSLDRQRDEAWVAGPGIGWGPFGPGDLGWMPDSKSIWFQSEETGYSHLYTLDVKSEKKKALTSGDFEIYDPEISNDKSKWYFSSNEVNSGEKHFYSMPLKGGKRTQITSMMGGNVVTMSPDETKLAIRYSYANKPWELYLMDNTPGSSATKITDSQTDEWKKYDWREPEFVTFTARDGAKVPARLYKPENYQEGGPAVIFVHGAGYLQNAHKWWSNYFREYMFHNILVDNGYAVLDIDYRASAGYGRDWRTAIYRHMGGWDLNDQIDGAKYLVESHGVSEDRIGIYGGSYGGFMTMMALFTQPDVFACGAALRSVTDWAHYNHPYTSNILNTPELDPQAYKMSSPIYFAEGLTKPLLIAHGMIDTNVHFQDVVRLSQRLIELGKEDWEMAVYPVERHGFVEPSSWADEYSRIFKLFEENLK